MARAKNSGRQGPYDRGGIPQARLNKAGRRRTTVVCVGRVTGADNFMVALSPLAGMKPTAVYFTTNNLMYHAAAEADTWIINAVDASSGNALNSVAASLSGQSLSATSFKDIGINQNLTMETHAGLQVKLTVSGTPQTMDQFTVFTEWMPFAEE